ncbi:metal-dependent hydrolase [Haloarcula sediminis]|uniref:metal-dependent hydrolase n=1 Tax=Haloarcula sediminis TaxID=3111777 RepID=UPI002D76E2AF|nr:metal-dependent hydrolase [Haloarcula sp. CK38]
MPSCESHLRVGALSHGAFVCLALAVVAVGGYPHSMVAYAGAALPATLLGAVFPDVDHHASKAYRVVRTAVPVGLTAAVAALGYAGWVELRPVVAVAEGPQLPFFTGVCWTTVVVATWTASQPLVPALRPPHRGPTHRLPVVGLVSAILAGVVVAPLLALGFPIPLLGGTSIAFAFVTGVVSHLHLDGLLTERETYLCVR